MARYSIMGKRYRPRTELTEMQVRKIKFQHLPPKDEGGEDWSVKQCAEFYGVCQETIRRIGRADSWAWVTPEAIDVVFAQAPLELTPEQKERAARASAAIARMLESDKPKEGA